MEDNTTNQQVALWLLDRLGYRTDVAANGLEALEALQRQPYDVVLMDVQMPELDGLEATRRVRSALQPTLQPYVVAMTANAMEGDRNECLQAGMDDYLSKPIRLTELVSALQRCGPLGTWLAKARAHASASTLGAAPAPATSPARESEPNPETAPAVEIDPAALERMKATLGRRAAQALPSLFATFRADAPQLLAEVRRTLAVRDAPALRRAAHTLKSNSAQFGAVALAATARQIEELARQGQLDGVDALADQAEAALAKTCLALETHLSATVSRTAE